MADSFNTVTSKALSLISFSRLFAALLVVLLCSTGGVFIVLLLVRTFRGPLVFSFGGRILLILAFFGG